MNPSVVDQLLRRLEAQDQREREGGLPPERRIRAVRREVGQFLNLLMKATRARRVLEIGTSVGYSTIWLGLAAQTNAGRVTTLEVHAERAEVARANLAEAGLDNVVTVLVGDARKLLRALEGPFDFVFIDAEKEEYGTYLDLVVSRTKSGCLIVADNVVSHADALRPYVEKARTHPQLESVVVPIGRGEAVSLKVNQRLSTDILAFLEELEAFARERKGMYNVPHDAGHFLHILVRAIKARRVLEVGTSNGYSGIWLATALQRTGGKLVTIERDSAKVNLARKTFRRAGVAQLVDLRVGDASRVLSKVAGPLDLVFFDATKEDQLDHLRLVFDQIRPGGLIVSDNALTHPGDLAPYHSFVRSHPALESLLVPIGNGFEISMRRFVNQ